MVIEEQGLGTTFALVITRTDSDRIDVAPVGLGLRMQFGIAIDLGGGGLENPRTSALGKPETMNRSHHRGLDGLDRVVLVVRRRGRAGEVVDLIDFELERLGHIMADQFEVGIS